MVVGSSPACVSWEEFFLLKYENWITRIIYLVHKLCYLKRGKWLSSNIGGSIPSQFYPSKEEIITLTYGSTNTINYPLQNDGVKTQIDYSKFFLELRYLCYHTYK